jgi:hypothetical protein
MKHNKTHDYSTLIIWASALVGMIRYAAAFLSSDLGMITGRLSEIVTVALGVSGFAMGILGTLGTTYIFDGWRSKMPATGARWGNKFISLTVLVALAFITEILILVPFTMSRVLHVSVADVLLGGVWWWSTAVVVMPFILIGGVSVGNQIVSVVHGQSPVKSGQISDNYPAGQTVKRRRNELTAADLKAIASMSSAQITTQYGCDERTARRWRQEAQRTTPPFP